MYKQLSTSYIYKLSVRTYTEYTSLRMHMIYNSKNQVHFI